MIGLVLAFALSAQTPAPEPRFMVLHNGTETTRTERDLQIEYRQLSRLKSPTFGQHKRLAAVTATLGSIPYRCTVGQERAGLCLRVTK